MSYHYNWTPEQRQRIQQKLDNNIQDLIRHHKQDGIKVSDDKTRVGVSQITYVDIIGIIYDYMRLHEDFEPDKQPAKGWLVLALMRLIRLLQSWLFKLLINQQQKNNEVKATAQKALSNWLPKWAGKEAT